MGTKVLLIQEDGVQVRQVATTMGSHSQQNDGRIHFGLGSGGALRDVIVYWPDGRIQSPGRLEAGRYHRVRKLRSPKRPLRLSAPREVKVGEEARFRVNDFGKGVLYHWDFGGSRYPEQITDVPEARHCFTTPGPHLIQVRAARPKGSGAEARAVIQVSED